MMRYIKIKMSNNNLEKAQQIMEVMPGVIDLLTLGVCGIIELAASYENHIS